jgi:hypothetical protein
VKYNTFELAIGLSVIAQRVSDGQFVYVRPEVVDAHPENYVPYDWELVEKGSGKKLTELLHGQTALRIPTQPTAQTGGI